MTQPHEHLAAALAMIEGRTLPSRGALAPIADALQKQTEVMKKEFVGPVVDRVSPLLVLDTLEVLAQEANTLLEEWETSNSISIARLAVVQAKVSRVMNILLQRQLAKEAK